MLAMTAMDVAMLAVGLAVAQEADAQDQAQHNEHCTSEGTDSPCCADARNATCQDDKAHTCRTHHEHADGAPGGADSVDPRTATNPDVATVSAWSAFRLALWFWCKSG